METISRLSEPVIAPGRILPDVDETGTSKVRQMPRHGGLRDPEDGDEFAHTSRHPAAKGGCAVSFDPRTRETTDRPALVPAGASPQLQCKRRMDAAQ